MYTAMGQNHRLELVAQLLRVLSALAEDLG